MKKLFRFLKKKKSGFTLIELVVYMGILTILLSILGSVFTEIVDVQLSSKSTSSINQDGRYLLAKFIYAFQANTPVIIDDYNAIGNSMPELHVKINGNTTADVYSVNNNGNLTLTNSSGITQLNSYDTAISNFSATRIGNGGTSDAVRVSFTIRSKINKQSGYETQTFQSTFQGH